MSNFDYAPHGTPIPLNPTPVKQHGHLVGWVAKSGPTREWVAFKPNGRETMLWAWGAADKKTAVALLDEPRMVVSRFSGA